MELKGAIVSQYLKGSLNIGSSGSSPPTKTDYITSAEVSAGLTATETQSEIYTYEEVNE